VSGDSFVVQVAGGKEVTLYSGPKSIYRRNDKTIRFEEIRAGMPISAIYDVSGDRYLINTVTLEDRAAPVDRTTVGGAEFEAASSGPALSQITSSSRHSTARR
jgi:hypothetical protein